MLAKASRLNLSHQFKWVVSGKRLETPSLILFAKQGQNPNFLIGVSLKKSSFKKAVDRNAVKRKIYQAVTPLIQSFPNNLNLIIMPKSQAQEVSVSELELELKNGLSRLFGH